MDTQDIIKQLKEIKKGDKTKNRAEALSKLFSAEIVGVSIKDNYISIRLSDGQVIKSEEFAKILTPNEVISLIKNNSTDINENDVISLIKKHNSELTENDVISLIKKHNSELTEGDVLALIEENKFKLDPKNFIEVAKVVTDNVNKTVDLKVKRVDSNVGDIKVKLDKVADKTNIQTIRQDLEGLYSENKLDAKYIKNLPKLGTEKNLVKNSSTKYLAKLKDVDLTAVPFVGGKYILGGGGAFELDGTTIKETGLTGVSTNDFVVGADSVYNATSGPRVSFDSSKSAFRAGSYYDPSSEDAVVGSYSTAFGENNTASGARSFAIGSGAVASGVASTAIGAAVTSSGTASFAAGFSSSSTATGSTAFGSSDATANYSTALGNSSTASGIDALSTGDNTIASGADSASFGKQTTASGNQSFAAGNQSVSSGEGSVSFGDQGTSSGDFSFSSGQSNTSSGDQSTSFGSNNTASGNYSSAFGSNNETSGQRSMAIGDSVTTSANASVGIGSSLTNNVASSAIVGLFGQLNTDARFGVASGSSGDEDVVGGGLVFEVKGDGTQLQGNGTQELFTFIGTGTPEGVVIGSPGDNFKDATGKLWVKETGTGTNTGWSALSTGGGGGAWGDITGTLSDQTDLQAALNLKQDILSEGEFVDGDKTKLDGIEASADVTDETNVVAALDGATLTDVDLASDDKILIQDTSDSDNLKTVDASDLDKEHMYQFNGLWELHTDNRWITFTSLYTQNYYFARLTGGVGMAPSSTSKYKNQGLFLPEGAVITRVVVQGYANNSNPTDLGLHIEEIGGDYGAGFISNATADIQTIYNNYTGIGMPGTSMTYVQAKEININHTLTKDRNIAIWMMPVGTLTGLRYWSGGVNVYYKMP